MNKDYLFCMCSLILREPCYNWNENKLTVCVCYDYGNGEAIPGWIKVIPCSLCGFGKEEESNKWNTKKKNILLWKFVKKW